MKKLLFLLVIASQLQTAGAQNIVVEKVQITETIDKKTVSNIPRVSDRGRQNPNVDKINSFLLETFDIPSYDPRQIKEFRWYDVDFDAEINSGIIYIRYAGEYYGAYPNQVEAELFFDLSTGEKMDNRDIPFQALFSLQGYLDFLNRYWFTPALKDAFKKASTCAGSEPSCSYYDISNFTIEEGLFKASLETECYPHAAQACSPSHSIAVPLDSVKPHLTETAKKMLLVDHYYEKRGVEKFLYNKSAWKDMPHNLYLFGLINDKYPFSMAITINQESGATTGYYYYDKKMQKINLKGTFAHNILDMTEAVNNTQTGKFYFTWTDQYNEEAIALYDTHGKGEYLNGTWLSMDGSKKFKIRLTEVVATKN